MDFFSWHYTLGLSFYIKRWKDTVLFVNHYFSLPLLVTSFFSPYKRLVVSDSASGVNIGRSLSAMSFNLISRFMGAIVRFFLIITGCIFLLAVGISGVLGLFVWILFPPFGILFWAKYQNHPKLFAKKIWSRIILHPKNAVSFLFQNVAGEYVLSRVGLSLSDLYQNAKVDLSFEKNFSPDSFSELIGYFLKNNAWSESFLRSHETLPSDFLMSAHAWDELQKKKVDLGDQEIKFGRPGIGLELLYGFTPTLNKHSVDLSLPSSFSHHLIGRGEAVSRMERALSSGSSVIVTGEPGVGKKTVVLEFAKRAAQGELGAHLSRRRVMEFDYNFILSDSLDPNQKKVGLSEVLSEAEGAGNIILVMRDLHKITNQLLEGIDFTDTLERFLEKKELKIIAISSLSDYEKFISQNSRLRKFFEIVEVYEPTMEEAGQILSEAALSWEEKERIVIRANALRTILENSEKYISEAPFPEKAIELLDEAVSYCVKENKKTLEINDVNSVLAEKTGISFARLTESEKDVLSNIEDIIHENLINQKAAVSLIAKSLRARSVGAKEDERPIGSFLFLGPTGVGKTQTAKVLSQVYFGKEAKIIRFDMAEYAGGEGIERLIGSVSRNEVGLLTTAIKNRPASLLLLDEIEKAPPSVYNLLLTLLDEGYITDAFGKKISCRNLFVIATSNAAAGKIRDLVLEGVDAEELQKKTVEFILGQSIFSPELLNRFDGVVVFEPLSPDHLLKVAELMLKDLSKNILLSKNIVLEVSKEATEKLAHEGYEPEFGARPMRRIIDLSIGDVLGRAILSGEISPGEKVKLLPKEERNEYSWEKIE